MTESLQTLVPAFTPPPAAVAWPISDTPNAKTKLAAYVLAPAAGAPAISTAQIMRAVAGQSLVALATLPTNPLTIGVPSTQTGFAAYRQCPNFGLARNLASNGGFLSGSHGWALHANASVVVDATSPTGYAVRTVATAAGQNSTHDIPIEANLGYSFAVQMRADGVSNAQLTLAWLDAAGAQIGGNITIGSGLGTGWTEFALANQTAPGNAQKARLALSNSAAGVFFHAAIRAMQQATAPAAWTAAHQQYIARGLAIYEAGTNSAADGDMEAAGVASYTATTATLTKDTTKKFAGAQSLKVVNTAANGKAAQTGALAAGQAITASVRYIGGDVGAGMQLVSTPGGTLIGTAQLGLTTDWTAVRASGVIAVGDTGWRVDLIGGSGATTTSWFDNLAVENKAYDTMNADPSGQAFALASRVVSATQVPAPSGFDLNNFAAAGVVRFDHAYNAGGSSKRIFGYVIDGNNYLYLEGYAGGVEAVRARAGNISGNPAVVGAAGQFVAGDTVAWAIRYDTTAGFSLWVSINGAAPTKNTDASIGALVPLSGSISTANLQVGNVGSVGWINGTVGALRILKGGLSDATISALVSNPLADPTDNDLAVWLFEGQTYQLPVFDDRIIKLGTSYDYATTIVGTNSSAALGARTTATTNPRTTFPGAWWLRSQQDPTKDINILVLKQHAYKVKRGALVIEPVSGGLPSVIYTGAPQGMDSILDILASYTTAAAMDTAEGLIRGLLATQDTVWLLSPFGGLFKVRLPAGVEISRHEIFLDVKLPALEVS